MADQPLPPALDAATAADLLSMSPRAVYRAIAAGDLPSIRLGRRVLIPTAKLLVMLGLSPERADGRIEIPLPNIVSGPPS